MMKIYDGREFFYQWDLSQKITSDAFEVGDKIHFFNIRQTNALVVSAYELDGKVVADVPNILLQTAVPIKVWKYVHGENSAQTVMEDTFKVEQRAQPYDYFYTETELYELRKEIEDTAKDAQNAVSQLYTGLRNAEEALELATEAEKTSTENEQERVDAENARVEAEENRVLAETQRATAESDRAKAETTRAKNESDRVDAEAERVIAEQSRETTENQRRSFEIGRDNAEYERVKAETARQKSETARETAETNRATAETERVTAETARKTAETSRGTAESQRVTAEQNRMEAEQNRETAEQNRAAAEELRQANFESLPNNIGNAVKGTASGEVVRVDDVSPIEHIASVKVQSKNLCKINVIDTNNSGGQKAVNITKPITISFKKTEDYATSSKIWRIRVKYLDGNSLYIVDDDLVGKTETEYEYSFEATESNPIVEIFIRNTYITTGCLYDVQIEFGDTATEYKPYIDPTTVTVTRYGANETDNPQTYIPSTDGTCEVEALSPTMTLVTDNPKVTIGLEYNQDTTKAFENVKSDLQELDNTVAEIILNGGGGGDTPISNYYTKGEIDILLGDVETALDNIIAIQETLIGGDSV